MNINDFANLRYTELNKEQRQFLEDTINGFNLTLDQKNKIGIGFMLGLTIKQSLTNL